MPKGNASCSVLLTEEALNYLNRLDKMQQTRVRKRLEALAWLRPARTLKKHPDIWVLEIGGFRALYLIYGIKNTKTVFFIGNHKEYEKRYLQMF